jgi:hypothetical protein
MPSRVAECIDSFVQEDASDGFTIGSHLVPGGLDEFVDKVVPVLPELWLRAQYTGATLRDNLRIGVPSQRFRPTR